MTKAQAQAFVHALFGARSGEYCYVDNCPFAVSILEQHVGVCENHNERMQKAESLLDDVVAALRSEDLP